MDNIPFVIVGVAEPGFRGNYLPAPAELFIPLSMFDPIQLDRRDSTWLSLFGRLAPGATLATWTVAEDVTRRLAAADFQWQKRPGFGNKRYMLKAWVPGARADAVHVPAVQFHRWAASVD